MNFFEFYISDFLLVFWGFSGIFFQKFHENLIA